MSTIKMSHGDKSIRKVLFVCLGNICRSPMAEAVFTNLVEQKGATDRWEADSCALGPWHVGNMADSRARSVLRKHGIEYKCRARQIEKKDFKEYDFIFGMDENNISELTSLAPEGTREKIQLLGEYDPTGNRIVRDPYYDTGADGFEQVYQQCVRCIKSFLDQHET